MGFDECTNANIGLGMMLGVCPGNQVGGTGGSLVVSKYLLGVTLRPCLELYI